MQLAKLLPTMVQADPFVKRLYPEKAESAAQVLVGALRPRM